MKWSDHKPTEPGVYWLRVPGHDAVPVRLREDRVEYFRTQGTNTLNEIPQPSWWYGPIKPPVGPI